MEPLIILIAAFVLSLIISKLITRQPKLILSGNIAMSAMLFFTAIGHFVYPAGMAMMLPDFIPFKLGMVYFTSFVEIAAAVGLLIPALRYWTGVLLILFFILVLPANINAAIKQVDLKNASYTGKGLSYLWFRVPLQILFIVWVWYFAIRKTNERSR
jgi:uncharacterized membrane protein